MVYRASLSGAPGTGTCSGPGALHRTCRAEAQAPGAHVTSQAHLGPAAAVGVVSCRLRLAFSCQGPTPGTCSAPFPILPQNLLPGCGSLQGSHADMFGTTPSVGALNRGRWGLSWGTVLGNSPGSIYLLRGQQRCHHTCVLTSPPFPLSSPHAVIIASCNHLPQISPAPLGESTLRHTESESGNVPGNCTYAHSLGGFQALLTWRVLPAVGFPCVRTKGPACKSCWAVNVLGTFHPPP